MVAWQLLGLIKSLRNLAINISYNNVDSGLTSYSIKVTHSTPCSLIVSFVLVVCIYKIVDRVIWLNRWRLIIYILLIIDPTTVTEKMTPTRHQLQNNMIKMQGMAVKLFKYPWSNAEPGLQTVPHSSTSSFIASTSLHYIINGCFAECYREL